jgi:hypothetical protein
MTSKIFERQNKLSQHLDAVQKDVQHVNRSAATIPNLTSHKVRLIHPCLNIMNSSLRSEIVHGSM